MLAYFDSFSGLVPCRILSVDRTPDTMGSSAFVEVQFTAPRGPFRRGEKYTTFLHRVVPRNAIRRTRYHTRIRAHDWNKIPGFAQLQR